MKTNEILKEVLQAQRTEAQEVQATATQKLVQDISAAFFETFDLSGITYSEVSIGRERAEFKCDDSWGGEVSLYYYETYDQNAPVLEMSVPSFRDSNFDRVIAYGKIAEQAKLNGEAFITKLQFLKKNYKSNIESVIDKIYRLEKEIREIEKLEHQEKINQALNRLTNEGLVFEFSKAFDVSAKSAISTNYVKATPNKGKKTYSLEYKILDKVFVVDRVKEMYIRSIAERVVNGLR
jgi:hypothetical protein